MEENWYAGHMQRQNAALMTVATCWAPLVGYSQFLRAAGIASNVLASARVFAALGCSGAKLESFAQHVVHAAELMQQPRRHGNVALEVESAFTDAFRSTVEEAGGCGLDARLVQLLAGAWERLQRSGVLRSRHIEDHIRYTPPGRQSFVDTVQNSLSAPGLRTCALDGCGAKEAHPAHFKSCAACRAVVYCCREHQVAAWPAHKKACKAVRKAVAADADAAGPSGA